MHTEFCHSLLQITIVVIVHMNYCVGYSTCQYYEPTNCKIGLLKLRVQVNKVISNCTVYGTQVKQIMNTAWFLPSEY